MNVCRSCGSPLEGNPRYCPSCGSFVTVTESATGAPARSRGSATRRAATVLIPAAAFVGAVLVWQYLHPKIHPVIAAQPVVDQDVHADTGQVVMTPIAARIDGDDLVIRLDDVRRHRLVRFEYAGATTTRPLLAYIARDGHLVTAVSVSEHCGSSEFVLKGDRIHCARCPSSWDMLTFEAFACCARYYPDPIASRVVGGEVRIARGDIERWAGRL